MVELAPPPVPKDHEQLSLDVRPWYIADRDFRQSVNGVTVSYKKGTIFRDPAAIVALQEHRAPISRVRDPADLVVCPHCQQSFSLKVQQGAMALLERARSLMGGRV